MIRSFLIITRTTFSQPAASTFSLPGHKSFTGKQLIKAIKRRSKQAATDRKLSAHLSTKLQKVPNFAKLCPAQRIRKLSEAKVAPRVGQVHFQLYTGQCDQAGQRLPPCSRVSFSMLYSFLRDTRSTSFPAYGRGSIAAE